MNKEYDFPPFDGCDSGERTLRLYIMDTLTKTDEFTVSLAEATAQLPVIHNTVWLLVRRGAIPSIMIGRKYFIRQSDVDYIRQFGTRGLPKPTPVLKETQ